MSPSLHKNRSASRACVEGTTRVVGIVGNPVEHSLSPRMHNAAYAALGLDFVYVPFRTAPDQVRSVVRAMHTLGVVGYNVTVPYKQDVVRLVDRLTPAAAAIGAVNTIWRDGGEIVGDNTDAVGFVAALRSHGVRLRGARVLVIGAGGSARAVLHALVEGGAADVVIANRTVTTAARLAREFAATPRTKASRGRRAAGVAATPTTGIRASGLAVLEDATLLASRTLVVNCTPVGLKGGAFLGYRVGATPKDCPHFDLAYGRDLMPFLALASKAGRPIIDGRHMLVHQGAAAFRLFTGRKAPVGVMLEAVGLAPARRKR